MAVTDAYATVAEFRSRVESSSGDDDAEIEAQLRAASRFIDRLCGRYFTRDAAVVTRTYDGRRSIAIYNRLFEEDIPRGRTVFRIDDLASTTGLIVRVDLNEDYTCEQVLTLNTHFWVGPPNATAGSEPRPYRYLEIVPNNGVLDTWPDGRRGIQVTGLWGWPSVPDAIREATVQITRAMRDLQEAGMTQALAGIDTAMGTRIVDRVPKMIDTLLKQYGAPRRPFV